MLAEMFERKQGKSELPDEIQTIEEGAKEFIFDAQAESPNFSKKIDIFSLYENFIDRKFYKIFGGEKQILNTAIASDQRKKYINFIDDHNLLSLYALLEKQQCEKLLSNDQINLVKVLITSIKIGEANLGIVDQIIDNKPHFVHRSFAEYFMADYVVKQLTKEYPPSKEFQDCLIREILSSWNYDVIRSFIKLALERAKIPQTILEQFGNHIEHVYRDAEDRKERNAVLRSLDKAAEEENINIIPFIVGSLKLGNNVDTLIKLLQYANKTIWHTAVRRGSIEFIEMLLKTIGSKKDLLLTEDRYKRRTWDIAAEKGHTELLKKLWEYGKEEGVDMKKDLLYRNNSSGNQGW